MSDAVGGMGRCCCVEMGPQAERIKSISIYGRGSDRGCWAPGGSSGILQLVAGKEAGKRWVLRTHIYSRIAFAHTRLSLKNTCRVQVGHGRVQVVVSV